jgi:hypothetical protein
LRPEEDFTEQLGPPVVRDSWKHEFSYSVPKQTKHSVAVRPIPQESTHRQRLVSPQLKAHKSFHGNGSFWSRDRSPADEDPLSSDDFVSSSEEEYAETSLVHGVKRLTLHGLAPVANVIDSPTDAGHEERDTQMRFHGKSSSFYLIGPTREFRKRHMDALHGISMSLAENPPLRRPIFWTSMPVS